MIGGKVYLTVQKEGDIYEVFVRGLGSEKNDECKVTVRPGADIKHGDSLWWQSNVAFWKPKGKNKERRLEKIGYSTSV